MCSPKKGVNTIQVEIFDRLSLPDKFANALKEKVHKLPVLSKYHAVPMDHTRKETAKKVRKKRRPAHRSATIRKRFIIEGVVQWHGVVLAVKTKRKLRNRLLVAWKKPKNVPSYSSSLTFLKNEIECTASAENPESKSADCEHETRHRTEDGVDGLQIFQKKNNRFHSAAKHRTYPSGKKLSEYSHIISWDNIKMSKRMTAEIKPQTFESPIKY